MACEKASYKSVIEKNATKIPCSIFTFTFTTIQSHKLISFQFYICKQLTVGSVFCALVMATVIVTRNGCSSAP